MTDDTPAPDAPIAITYELPAPRERVFRALTDPVDMDAWMWGGMGRDRTSRVDLRPGGAWCATMRVDDPGGWPRSTWRMHGRYVVVEPPRRLVYTLHWDAPVVYNERDDDVADELVFIRLEPAGAGTTMQYEHRGVPTRTAADAHAGAIRATFDLLARHLAAHP